ncbi:Acetyltransferase (GNAT) family protein [Glycomyces sambucus]|uniref:Acetyltransferase (GNAT) family protein n=1 Tax=Glycomyces sambucus TaxID=380244 RepID=A0A1G9EWB5_9ACTN|nr:GNAT family N-acetyltransferase [Glycomyces sambucus]SDK80295.1 Acetyltransferase (GNAT) family protein [Glycomyces sambucus]
MTTSLERPRPHETPAALTALRDWQHDGAVMQLHPGDLGWYHRFGADTAADATRTWSRDGRILAVGLLDGPDLLRLTTAPDARDDRALAERIADDLADPDRGVLPAGRVNVEAPADAALQDVLAERGWPTDDPWTPLRRDLTDPVEDPGVHIETVGPDRVQDRVDIHVASFDQTTFTVERWHAMAAGAAYADARCLVAYDGGVPVAGVTVWSAGPGRPGLLEPMGAHRDHRGRGFGRAITIAAAAALRDLGASSAVVATPSDNPGAVATYASGGFTAGPEIRDRYRP